MSTLDTAIQPCTEVFAKSGKKKELEVTVQSTEK